MMGSLTCKTRNHTQYTQVSDASRSQGSSAPPPPPTSPISIPLTCPPSFRNSPQHVRLQVHHCGDGSRWIFSTEKILHNVLHRSRPGPQSYVPIALDVVTSCSRMRGGSHTTSDHFNTSPKSILKFMACNITASAWNASIMSIVQNLSAKISFAMVEAAMTLNQLISFLGNHNPISKFNVGSMRKILSENQWGDDGG